jgi:phosphatidate cytidylyltransferase
VSLLLGAAGMYFANKKVDEKTKRQRWLKYATYIIITFVVLVSIWYNLFYITASVIVLFGAYEIISVSLQSSSISTYQRSIAFIFFGIVAATFLLFSLVIQKDWLLYIYLQVIVFDAFCQITGQLIGKRKLAPGISEGKTLEGLLGGSVFCLAISIVLASFIHTSVANAAILGIVTSVSALSGDLLGSYYKRLTGIKDFSKLLPGQGGFIDRFGSFLMTGTFYYILHYLSFSFN